MSEPREVHRYRVMVTVPQQFVEVVEASSHREALEFVLQAASDGAVVPFVSLEPSEQSVVRLPRAHG